MTTPLLIGVVLGADYVVSKSLVTAHAPRSFRGRLMSLLAVAWAPATLPPTSSATYSPSSAASPGDTCSPPALFPLC
ncbi:hypothetical protein OYT95_36450 [Rhodococcus sp. JS3073]|nr:hypothetical protein [Rhodococcus sp. JS3073]WAM14811.1 hypothetical protein OYT95_36450 [Rhodococcus sp. JS3073]